jgi:hypothetical protein
VPKRLVTTVLLQAAVACAACATPSATSGEGTGERGRASFTTGIDAVDATDLAQGIAATIVQMTTFTGCWLTLGDDCASVAENAGRRAIGRAPRDVDDDGDDG